MMNEQYADHGTRLTLQHFDEGGFVAVIFDPLRGRTRPEPSRGDDEIIDVLTGTAGAVGIDTSGWAVLTGAGMSTDLGSPPTIGDPDAVPRQPMTIQTFLSRSRPASPLLGAFLGGLAADALCPA